MRPGGALTRRHSTPGRGRMSLFALVAWITTAGGGLYLLSIWLIEYDKDFQSVAATRLPPSVLTAHVLLAGGGLLAWIAYLIYDQDRLAWTAVVAILLAATLGVTMAIRWLSVYRAGRDARRSQAEQAEARLALVDSPGPYGSGPLRFRPSRFRPGRDAGTRAGLRAAGAQLPAARRHRARRVRRRDHHPGAADRAWRRRQLIRLAGPRPSGPSRVPAAHPASPAGRRAAPGRRRSR